MIIEQTFQCDWPNCSNKLIISSKEHLSDYNWEYRDTKIVCSEHRFKSTKQLIRALKLQITIYVTDEICYTDGKDQYILLKAFKNEIYYPLRLLSKHVSFYSGELDSVLRILENKSISYSLKTKEK